MALSLATLRNYAKTASGSKPDGRVDMDAVVNRAGYYLVGMRKWSWRARPPVSLPEVGEQSWLALPEDFGSDGIVESVWEGDTGQQIYPTTLAEIARLRATSDTTGTPTRYAVSTPAKSSTTTGLPHPRLEIWPTPETGSTDSLTLVYYGGWVYLSDPSHVASVPPEAEEALIELVTIFALRAIDPAAGIARLGQFEQGPFVNSLEEASRSRQSIAGQHKPGDVAAMLAAQGVSSYRSLTSYTLTNITG